MVPPPVVIDEDAAALLALARRKLVGEGVGPDPEGAIALLARAASLGSPEAMLQSAVLAAAGIGVPQSWPDALDHLQKAAEFGLASAQEQLAILGGLTGECAPEVKPSWSEARQQVDLADWLSFPARRPVCERPRVRSIDGFLKPGACRWLIGRARHRLARATMFNPESGRDEFYPERSNSAFLFDLASADVILAIVRAKVAAALQRPTFCLEPTQVFHYACGQQIGPHYDFLADRKMVDYRTGRPYEGQRVATFLIYLNGDFEGGETDFIRAPYSFKGAEGDAVYFANVDSLGEPDPTSLHAGRPPTQGEKWIVSQWMHDRAFTGVSSGS